MNTFVRTCWFPKRNSLVGDAIRWRAIVSGGPNDNA